MAMTKQHFKELVQGFKFKELFIEMGWDNVNLNISQSADTLDFAFQIIAEKSGFKILLCSPDTNGKIPLYAIRKKLENKIRKLYYEHLIIFIDDNKQNQLWQFTIKQTGKPLKVVETPYNVNQYPELLYQRVSGMFFSMDEEEKITIIDVTQRVTANISQNADKVTKQFYDKFKKEHSAFLGFIKGIEEEVNQKWYASLMLNRLMFCYFIQYRGFLDNNKNYLRDKLEECKQKKGANKFYSFYKNFLLVLFHEGLGKPDHDKLIPELGKIPYLNGGLFDQHELEKLYKDQIEIADAAFERIFDFFDQYNWHLDTRVTSTGKDINPDVIGYIFEKYINDRAEMGAYYTKEDITDYIGKNTIIPWLFDEVQRNYAKPFKSEGEIWTKLKASGDCYIYDAVKYGINSDDVWGDVPENVKVGLDPNQENLVEIRKCWNKSAPSEVALPTEIWREVIDRRHRYIDVKQKIEQGEIDQINDLITYNLNIRQFAIDTLQDSEDPGLIKEFYKALNKVTILDPTCGSGAFLFAAMNILEDLYEVCIQRMQEFVEESTKGKHKTFEEELTKVNAKVHPNREYFIYKSIILNNLYGVDIMNEAVEIAKLRLFLKLVACVDINLRDANYGLEPLPDIDFNIRCGNTLVGYANEQEIENHCQDDALASLEKDKVKDNCDAIAKAFQRFKNLQLEEDPDYLDFQRAKLELNTRLNDLTEFLDGLIRKNTSSLSPNKWKEAYKPFHWVAEFYEIINGNKGFDIIIGNPPYVSKTKITYSYLSSIFANVKCDNVYALFIERSLAIENSKSKFGMIIPVSIISGDTYYDSYKCVKENATWISSYSNRPGKLFYGVEQRLVVLLTTKQTGVHYTTFYKHWYEEERSVLFNLLEYHKTQFPFSQFPVKIGNALSCSISDKTYIANGNLQKYYGVDNYSCWFHDGPTYWIRALPFNPIENIGNNSNHYHILQSSSTTYACIINAILLSSTFYFHYKINSNCRDFGFREINMFKFPESILAFSSTLAYLLSDIKTKLINTSSDCSRNYKGNIVNYKEYYPALVKNYIDEIDKILAQTYGFTQEELDFIINYDIKYRMGKELEAEE